MKKLFISLAALAALASCVEENNLEPQPQPQQPQAENTVTIKAVAAQTKTLLNGTAVEWEDDDAIMMVLEGDLKKYYTELTTSLESPSAEAEFTGEMDAEIREDQSIKDAGFVVYPASAVVDKQTGEIVHTIADKQHGTVSSGSNLSYAAVSYADLLADTPAEAGFHNLYSLIRIKVAEGMTKVTLASESPLAGTAPFKFENEALKIDETKWDPNTYADYKKNKVVELTEDGEGEMSADKTYDVLVFPGTHTLTITVSDGQTEFSRTIKPNTFEASKFYNLDLSSIFAIGKSEFEASPFGGGSIEIPLLSTFAEEVYEVTFDFGTENPWLSSSPAVKGAFREDVVSITVADGGNTTGATRTASVTIKGATSGKQVVAVVSQKAYVKELINEYLESYTMSGMSQTGTLSIKQSDDLSKGLYKVTICGVTLYADYESGTLTLYDGSNERKITVADDFSMLSAEQWNLGYSTITSYSAILPEGPAELTTEEMALVGKYEEKWSYDNSPVETENGSFMTISASDEAGYGQFKVKFLVLNAYSYFEAYADLEGNSLKIKVGGLSHQKYGTIYNPEEVITLTVNGDGTLTFDTWKDSKYKDLTNYVATKVENEPEIPGEGGDSSEGVADAASLEGTYSENFTDFSGSHTGTMTISVSGENINVKMLSYSTGMDYYLECPAVLNSDRNMLTIKCSGVTYVGWGLTVPQDINLNISVDGEKITLSIDKSYSLDWGDLSSYTATKQ